MSEEKNLAWTVNTCVHEGDQALRSWSTQLRSPSQPKVAVIVLTQHRGG